MYLNSTCFISIIFIDVTQNVVGDLTLVVLLTTSLHRNTFSVRSEAIYCKLVAMWYHFPRTDDVV